MTTLTKVQRDVLDRLRDGWEMEREGVSRGAFLRKSCEANRYVAWNTVDSLFEHAYIMGDPERLGYWVINEYWIERSGVLK